MKICSEKFFGFLLLIKIIIFDLSNLNLKLTFFSTFFSTFFFFNFFFFNRKLTLGWGFMERKGLRLLDRG